MKRTPLLTLLTMLAGTAGGQVLDICAASGEQAWLAVRRTAEDTDLSATCLYLSGDGKAAFVDTLGTVRSDAVHCRLLHREGGGCFSATSIGGGYTAVSLRAYRADGSLEWELEQDDICYDAPLGLLRTGDGGVLMLWDSFSDNRGLWVMRVTAEGVPLWKTFAIPTFHPFYTAFCGYGDDGCLVAAATVTAAADRVLVTLDSGGRENWGQGVEAVEKTGACAPIAAGSCNDGTLTLWTGSPAPESLDGLIAVMERSGSIERWEYSLDGLTGARILEVAGGGILAAGVSGETWVCSADSAGHIIRYMVFANGFLPEALDFCDGLIFIAGDTENGLFAACLEQEGGEVWNLVLTE